DRDRLAGAARGDLAGGRIDEPQGLAYRPREDPPILRELEATVHPHEQRRPQRILERLDLAADRRLGQGELVAGLREREMAGRRLEAPHHVERRQATQGVDRIRMILVHATNEDSAFVPAIVLPEHFTRRAEARKARLHRNASSSMNLAHTKENNMILRPPYGPVFLMPGQAIRLPGVGPLTLRVRSGSVWMTQAGRP